MRRGDLRRVSLLAVLAGALPISQARAGACDKPTVACPSVAALLDQREGYGRSATGGLDGEFAVVTSNADAGPGTLRELLATVQGPRWITFASTMTIDLQSALLVPSNVTIDGRGKTITLNDYGLGMFRANSNVIATHLTIDGRFKTVAQAINVSGDVHDIWLDHLDLSRFIDRLVDVKRGSTNVTLSWIKFHDHNKVMLLNNTTDKDMFANFNRDGGSQVTIHHSYFVNTIQRNPRAQFGVYQIYNNLLENWDFYAMSFSLEAKALVQGNIFNNSAHRSCTEPPLFETVEKLERNYCHGIGGASARAILPNGSADEKHYDESKATYGYTHDYRAFLKVRDNLFLGDVRPVSEEFRPERAPDLPECSSYEAPTEALAERIRREAGNTADASAVRKPVCAQ